MILFLSVFLPLLFIYVLTLSPTVPLEDGGEMIRAAFTLGVTHPPGYPLYSLVGRLACLVPVGDVAFRLNLMSAVFGAAGCGLAAVASRHLLEAAGPGRAKRVEPLRPRSGFDPERGRRSSRRIEGRRTCAARRSKGRLGAVAGSGIPVSAWLAAVLLGTGPALWWQSVIAEKYAMNFFFGAAVTAFVLAGVAGRGYPRGALVALGLLYGLGASHHGQMVYFAPAVGLAGLWLAGRIPRRRRARAVALGAMALVLGLSLKFVYPPVRAGGNPVHNWGDPATWARYRAYISGRSYHYRILHWDLPGLAGRAAEHAREGFHLPGQFGVAGVALGLAGLVRLVRTRPRLALLGASVWVTGAAYCLSFSLAGIAIRTYYIPTFLVFGLFLAGGLSWGGGRLARRPAKLAVPVGVAVLVALLWPVAGHRAEADRSRHYFAGDFARALLKSVEPPAFLVARSDYDLFPLWYSADVLAARPGVTVVRALAVEGSSGAPRRVRLYFPPGEERIGRRFRHVDGLFRADPGRPVYFSVVFPGVEALPLLPRGAAYRYLREGSDLARADVAGEWDRFRRRRTLRGVRDPAVPKDPNTRTMLSYYAHMAARRGFVLSLREGGCRAAAGLYREALRWPFWESGGKAAVHLSLARCLEALGDSAGALIEHREAVRLAPGWPLAARELAGIEGRMRGER